MNVNVGQPETNDKPRSISSEVPKSFLDTSFEKLLGKIIETYDQERLTEDERIAYDNTNTFMAYQDNEAIVRQVILNNDGAVKVYGLEDNVQEVCGPFIYEDTIPIEGSFEKVKTLDMKLHYETIGGC